MYTLRQVRKTTLFLYLVEQLPREREEQEENGGERVLHSKWPWQSLTQKSPPPTPPSCPDLKQGERWIHKGCMLRRIAPSAQDFTHFWQKSRHTNTVPKRKTETTHVSNDGTNLHHHRTPHSKHVTRTCRFIMYTKTEKAHYTGWGVHLLIGPSVSTVKIWGFGQRSWCICIFHFLGRERSLKFCTLSMYKWCQWGIHFIRCCCTPCHGRGTVLVQFY